MKIAIVGSGYVGKTYGKLLAEAGHEIILTWSSNAASLDQATDEVGHGARNAAPAVAVSDADLVLFGPRWEHIEAAAGAAGPWTGKLVVDATNPYNPQRDGYVDLGDRNASEVVIPFLPGARYVKAFNTLPVEQGFVTNTAGRTGADRVVIFMSGDDAEAKAVVGDIISQIGFAPFDLGSIAESARQDVHGIYNRDEFHLREGRPVHAGLQTR
jgi:8-hydroxy-5-deazaflavin:NADPH oxidoreductase